MRNLRSRILWMCTLAFCATSALALPGSQEGQKAQTTLKTAPYFAMGGVGFAGQTSPGEKALRVLLKEKDATTAFQTLLKEANSAGQLYALLGMKQTDPKLFAQVVVPYRKKMDKVKTMAGCIADELTVSNIITNIEQGRYRTQQNNEKQKAR